MLPKIKTNNTIFHLSHMAWSVQGSASLATGCEMNLKRSRVEVAPLAGAARMGLGSALLSRTESYTSLSATQEDRFEQTTTDHRITRKA